MVETKNTKPFYNSGIPYGWKLMELGELFAFKNGVNAGKESYGKGVKFINVMEVIYHDYIFPEMIPGTVQISEEQKELYLVKDGDVLFNRTSETAKEIGLSAVYNGNDDVVFGGFVIRGRPIINALDNTFKRYCFRSNLVRNQIIKGGQGAVRTNIGQGDLSQVKIVLPPLQEQKAIAALLGKWDEAIHKNQQLIAQKEERKKWLMQNLLTGKMRLKGFNEEWRKTGAGEIFKSYTKKGFTNEELLSATQDKGIIPRNQLEGRVTMPDGTTAGYKLVEPGDFVISLRSFQGGLEYSYYRGIVSPAYIVLKPIKKISDEFYKQYYKSYEFIGRLSTAVIGIRDGKQISYDDFCIVKIPFPEYEEQTAIAKVLQAADKEIQLLKTKADKLKEQKKGLMQVLLTGKKRLNLNLQD
jgi:type I restriction enzyme S subunit